MISARTWDLRSYESNTWCQCGTCPERAPAFPQVVRRLQEACQCVYYGSATSQLDSLHRPDSSRISIIIAPLLTHSSDPHELFLFLRHLGPVRCNELRSLHPEDFFLRRDLAGRKESSRLEQKAMRLLNKTGKIRKIYLVICPDHTVGYVEYCAETPGLTSCEFAFESPTRGSVMPPSRKWEPRPWFLTYWRKPLGNKPPHENWLGNKK